MSLLSFFKNLFLKNPSVSEIDEAIIISCYFNPMNSPYRRIGFDKFYEGIKQYNHKIVECVIGDSTPELPDNFKKVYTKSLLWHKETLLNNIIKTLPKKYKYIFWIDADVIFTNPNWLKEGVQAMKNGANIIQPFEYGIHLNKDEFAPSFNVNANRRNASIACLRHPQLWRSFCSNHPTLSGSINYDDHGHVGFAWGIKREVLDMVPGSLYDKALIGGADHIMAHAAAGHIPHYCITKTFGEDIVAVNEWSKMFYSAVQGKIGFVQGDLYHIWHGDLKDRQYLKRITEFTPRAKRIQERDENGLFITDEIDDTNYMLEYFMRREIANVNHTSDNISDNISDNVDVYVDTNAQFGGGGAGGSWDDEIYSASIGVDPDLSDTSNYSGPSYDNIHQDTTSFNLDNNNNNDYQGSTFS